jgi:saccharopine dehydrogenase-like NADP-dependent oxidoreductase
VKILVLGGAGAMGCEATRDLARTSDFEQIAVADLDRTRAQALVDELGGGRLRALSLDVTDEAALPAQFAPYDVVLNCTSYAYGLAITRAALEARRSLLDLGGLYNTPKQLALGPEAERRGVLVVLGMGATPGITNLMVRDAADSLERAEEAHVSFATFRPLAPSPGLLATVLDEFSPDTQRFYYEDGAHVPAQPFEGAREVEFAPPVGRITTYFVPHSEVHTLPRFVPGLRRVFVRGTWRPEIMAALRHYAEIGLLSREPLGLAAGTVAPMDVLAALHRRCHPWPDDRQWAFHLNVQVVGERGGVPVSVTHNLSHPLPAQWGHSATGRVTGIAASIGAQRLVRGELRARTGVLAPEAVFEPAPFFAALAEREIRIERSESAPRAQAAPAARGGADARRALSC